MSTDDEQVTLRWTRSYLVREFQTYEVQVPRAQAQEWIANPGPDADQYVTDNADPTDEWSDHVENRDLTGEGRILEDRCVLDGKPTACAGELVQVWHGRPVPVIACQRHVDENLPDVFQAVAS